MRVMLHKSSIDSDWEIKIKFEEHDSEDVVGLLDIVAIASTHETLYNKVCSLMSDEYGASLLQTILGGEDPEASQEKRDEGQPNPSANSEIILATIPLVGNINIQP